MGRAPEEGVEQVPERGPARGLRRHGRGVDVAGPVLLVPDVPLVFIESPYRALVGPLLAYLDVLDRTWPSGREAPITFVVIPEYVARSWWERILYNQNVKRLRTALLGRLHTVVVNVPYRRENGEGTISPATPAPMNEPETIR